MAISFRKREATEKIVVLIKDTTFVDYKSYYKYCRCQGELDIGVHYFVDADGTIHKARDHEAVAGWQYDDNTSIYIMVQSNSKKMNSCQKHVLPTLLDYLKKTYKDVEVIERID
jgi:hypothetical protein